MMEVTRRAADHDGGSPLPDSVRPWRVDDDEADGALAWSLLRRGQSTGARLASVHGEAAARRRRLEVERRGGAAA